MMSTRTVAFFKPFPMLWLWLTLCLVFVFMSYMHSNNNHAQSEQANPQNISQTQSIFEFTRMSELNPAFTHQICTQTNLDANINTLCNPNALSFLQVLAFEDNFARQVTLYQKATQRVKDRLQTLYNWL